MEEQGCKLCSRCKEEKPLIAFAKKARGRLQPYCRSCQAKYHHEHYLRNKATYVASARKGQARLQAILRAAKDKPCADCGVKYPYYVMDFDHREDEEKTSVLGQLAKRSGPKLIAEIAKCDVVCANCHRARTYLRKQWVNKRLRKSAN